MTSLLFKKWLLSEMADYGFDENPNSKIKGGTDVEKGDGLFKPLDGAIVIDELVHMPPLGPNKPCLKWHDLIEWGDGPGAFQAAMTTTGSLRIVFRRKIKDLQGEATWICRYVHALSDVKDQGREIAAAHQAYDVISEMNKEMLHGPAQEFDNFERLAWQLWGAIKRNHPSYIMYPIGLRKQNESYYKMVFEFRGQGAGVPDNGVAKQFDIDLFWDKRKGLIRCWGYDIDTYRQGHSWEIQPSEWDEYFSPSQNPREIIECIVQTFLQY